MDFQSFLNSLTPELQAFAASFPLTLLHAVVTLGLLFLGLALHLLTSPHKEISAINDGNAAAAVSLGGKVICLALPLAASLAASQSFVEILFWGGATIVVQLLLFWVVDLLLMGLPARVRDGEVSAAVLLVAAKLACAVILAAALAG